MPGCAARQRDPAAGARTAGVAPDDVADHDPPLSLHRLWACVAPGHQPGRRAAGEAVASRAAMGARRHRVVAMGGFTGFKTATSEELPDAVAVMDPFQVVRLAGDALDQCRRRVQQVTCGHRGRKGDPLNAARRTLHTGAALLTEKQQARLEALFAVSEHVEVEATWGIYQR